MNQFLQKLDGMTGNSATNVDVFNKKNCNHFTNYSIQSAKNEEADAIVRSALFKMEAQKQWHDFLLHEFLLGSKMGVSQSLAGKLPSKLKNKVDFTGIEAKIE